MIATWLLHECSVVILFFQDLVSPVGFKIGLELYVKCRVKQHAEVQIFFGKREAGESKLTGKVSAHVCVYVCTYVRTYV